MSSREKYESVSSENTGNEIAFNDYWPLKEYALETLLYVVYKRI